MGTDVDGVAVSLLTRDVRYCCIGVGCLLAVLEPYADEVALYLSVGVPGRVKLEHPDRVSFK